MKLKLDRTPFTNTSTLSQPKQILSHRARNSPLISHFEINLGTTPSKLKDRISNSPLQKPLIIAIQNLTKINNKQNRIQETQQTFSSYLQNMPIHSQLQNTLIHSQRIDLQNIQNLLQQFMESLYKSMQIEIYRKFHHQMKRIVLKCSQTERILNKINQHLNQNIDSFHQTRKIQQLEKLFQQEKIKYQEKIITLKHINQREKQTNEKLMNYKLKLESENLKLCQNLQKFNIILINRFTEQNKGKYDKMADSEEIINCRKDLYLQKSSTTNETQNSKDVKVNNKFQYNLTSSKGLHCINKNRIKPSFSPLKYKLTASYISNQR